MAESIFGIHERALQIRTARGEILANNLANEDTPNFKARDIDFRQAITQAQESLSQSKPDLVKTNSRHISGFADATTESFLKYRVPTQPSLDGNTVETHVEKAKFMENAMQHQATLEFINAKITGIRGALRGE
ncbi:flagellar basal body rod protein FlgB [Thiomicrorhabdus sp. ZW0627]|uniref:flagellar basal body rod protein FlgB n=1 Tax=Thiomicrorhabdus sp. ZW0627 TaxID=3039774 RepID=UPI0024366C42|nr:flagellar basal body rod protein FlgB [Thiomicrorhabdus sp. ZW0627]MDG6773378.1 flagellar basal body rod protein FlgB [Thiomicrorhabdus sp. ZW0627]